MEVANESHKSTRTTRKLLRDPICSRKYQKSKNDFSRKYQNRKNYFSKKYQNSKNDFNKKYQNSKKHLHRRLVVQQAKRLDAIVESQIVVRVVVVHLVADGLPTIRI
jgi:hypothetical protein